MEVNAIEAAPYLPPVLTIPIDATDGGGGHLRSALAQEWERDAEAKYTRFWVYGLCRKYPDESVENLTRAALNAAQGKLNPSELIEIIKDGLGEIERPHIRDGKPLTFRGYADILRNSFFKRVDGEFRDDPETAERLKGEYVDCQKEDASALNGFDVDQVMTFRKRPE